MDRNKVTEFRDGFGTFLRYLNKYLDKCDRGRKGGWVHVSDQNGNVVLHERVGRIDSPEKDERYQRLSAEKSTRLRAHPEHKTSWQSRDPDKGLWGGAFRADDGWIYSFSGLVELWDEALVFGLASFYDVTLRTNIDRIVSPGVKERVERIWQIDSMVDE